MGDFAEHIADSKIMQAIAIVVALGTLIGFCYKNAPPAFRFVRDAIEIGKRRATLKIMRPVMKRARWEYVDQRLIFLSTILMVLSAVNRLLILATLIFVEAISIMVAASGHHFHLPKIWELVVAGLVAGPLGAALSWFISIPTLRVIYYVYWCHRFAARDLCIKARFTEKRD